MFRTGNIGIRQAINIVEVHSVDCAIAITNKDITMAHEYIADMKYGVMVRKAQFFTDV